MTYFKKPTPVEIFRVTRESVVEVSDYLQKHLNPPIKVEIQKRDITFYWDNENINVPIDNYILVEDSELLILTKEELKKTYDKGYGDQEPLKKLEVEIENTKNVLTDLLTVIQGEIPHQKAYLKLKIDSIRGKLQS